MIYKYGIGEHVYIIENGIHINEVIIVNIEMCIRDSGNIVRIDNGIERFEEALADTKNSLENTEKQFETAKQEIEKPFAKEEELRAKTARLDELNILLNMDKKENEIVGGEPDEGEPCLLYTSQIRSDEERVSEGTSQSPLLQSPDEGRTEDVYKRQF